MKRIYYLSTCNTCLRIIHEIKPPSDFELIDIKKCNIEESVLDWLKEKVGSYEALFSKKAMKYRSLGLNNQSLSEQDYKKWMLEEYTFLKRPFIISGENFSVGSTKDAVSKAKELMFN